MKHFFFAGKMLDVLDSVYEPSEDSFLLAENVKVGKNSCCLDLGCGSGIQTIDMLLQGAHVLAIDVNEKALENTQKNVLAIGLQNNLEFRQSNLFSNIKKTEKFDCIVFNPPYVPSNGKKYAALDGGKKGREILDVFLQQFSAHLKKTGTCFFLQSSLNGEQKTKQFLQKKKLKFEIVARKKLFFEELMVFNTWKE